MRHWCPYQFLPNTAGAPDSRRSRMSGRARSLIVGIASRAVMGQDQRSGVEEVQAGRFVVPIAPWRRDAMRESRYLRGNRLCDLLPAYGSYALKACLNIGSRIPADIDRLPDSVICHEVEHA